MLGLIGLEANLDEVLSAGATQNCRAHGAVAVAAGVGPVRCKLAAGWVHAKPHVIDAVKKGVQFWSKQRRFFVVAVAAEEQIGFHQPHDRFRRGVAAIGKPFAQRRGDFLQRARGFRCQEQSADKQISGQKSLQLLVRRETVRRFSPAELLPKADKAASSICVKYRNSASERSMTGGS